MNPIPSDWISALPVPPAGMVAAYAVISLFIGDLVARIAPGWIKPINSITGIGVAAWWSRVHCGEVLPSVDLVVVGLLLGLAVTGLHKALQDLHIRDRTPRRPAGGG